MTDENTNAAPAPTPDAKPAKRKGKRRFFLRALLIVVVVAVAAWLAWYFLVGRWYVDTDDAYVHGHIVQITPKVPGTVVSIGVDNGDRVLAGQVLVKLDPTDTAVALAAAKANLAQAVRQVRGLYNNVEAVKAEVAARQVALDKARDDYQRRQGLAETGAISTEMLAHAHDALAAAKSALVAAQQKLNTTKALVAGTQVASNPGIKAAEAKLRAAYLNHARATLVAPVSGYVAKRSVQVGERVRPGMALMAVVPLDQVWVDANFKETQLAAMRIGQPVELVSDLYGDAVTYHGKVAALGIGTGSAFSLLPAQNATGNWIKIVQRVPVRVSLQQDELAKHPLRIGLSMTATVDIHDQDGPVLAQHPQPEPADTTNVYKQQLSAANALIDKIVQANL